MKAMKTRRVTLRLPVDLVEKLKRIAEYKKTTLDTLVAKALEEYTLTWYEIVEVEAPGEEY